MDPKELMIEKYNVLSKDIWVSPICKGLRDGALSLIPFFGTAISSALDTRLAIIAEKNSHIFAEELKRRMEHLDGNKIDKEFLESEEFVSLLMEILQKMNKVYEKDKIRSLSSIFINSSLTDKSKTKYKENFVRIVSDLSMDHIAVFSAICNKCDRTPPPQDFLSAADIAQQVSLPISRAIAYGFELTRYGIAADHGVGRYDYAPGNFTVTDYGKEFGAFLKDPI